MKLNKKIETEVLKIYDAWMHSYLHGDVEAYNSFLDDDYHFIGSAKNEEFLNRKDTTKFFEDTGDQFAGKTEIRDETKTIEQFAELIFITHIFDGWFLNENDWTYYARFRFTSVLKNTKEGWRFIYQHFSIPDPKTEEGETIGYDKINDENQELREAITRRTFELEAKNRELEIEGALERIRAQAVAMQQSIDLLDIVVTMRNEFTKLGHEAHYFWHMMWLPETYEKAMTSGDGTRVGFVMTLPRHIHGNIPLLANWEKSKDATVVYAMNTEEAIDYVDKMVELGDFQNIDPQAPSHDDIRHIGGLTFIMARTTHGEIGYSLPGVVKNPPKEDLQILERFADAFDLAHRRFLDLQKAEQQAREVQIELALEKVRSRTMAMQNSEELGDVILEVLKKFQDLDISMEHRATAIFTFEEGHKDYQQWVASPEYSSIISLLTPYFDHPIQNDIWNARQKGTDFYAKSYTVQEKNSLFNHLFNLPALKNMPKAEKTKALQFEYYDISIAFKKNAAIVVVSHSGVPLTEAENSLLKRLAKVFDQTYTRFLDLQKAEAQARESQIELGLERVRARAMAMRHSDELSDLVATVLNELTKLDFSLTMCIINIINEPDQSNMVWATNPEGDKEPESYYMRFEDYPFHHAMMRAWKEQKSKFVYTIEGKEKKIYDDYLYNETEFKRFSDEAKEANRALDKYVTSFTFSNFGGLQTVASEPLSDENLNILARFGKVFDLTYTRFNDLQKAEAQAREAQIEAALEKVRSRSLAVHRSDEFNEVVSIVFEKLKDLQIPATAVGIGMKIEGSKDLNSFVCGENEAGLVIINYRLPYFNNKIAKDLCNALEHERDFYVGHYSKKVKDAFYTYIVEHTEEFKDLPEDIIRMIFESPSYTISMVRSKHSVFNINDFEGKHLSENEIDILKRFSKVFNQAYTRFLDLQKAEAQTREAQIETALERVRSRTMAMQHSDELQEASFLLDQQVRALGIKTWGCAFHIYGEKESTEWFGNEAGILPTYKVPRTGIFKTYYQKGQKGASLHIKEFSGDACVAHYEYMSSLPVIGDVLKKLKETNNGFPTYQIDHVVYFKYGYLLFITKEPVPEAHDIFKRFANVFEQTYTRFLDLQRAEAQAREAKIEMALEKVRSRTMAMQSSSELPEAANNLFLQVQELGIPAWSAGYCIWEDDQKSASCNMSSEGVIQKGFSLPTIGEGYNFYAPYKNEEPFYVAELGGEALVKHYDFMKTLPIVGEVLEDFNTKGIALPSFQIFHIVYFTHGYLMFITYEAVPQDWEVFKRFGKVFQQTFTRFLDLQKAEAQAREAQIEAAMERIRSRSLAMHSSEELMDVAIELRRQIDSLGQLDLEASVIHLYSEGEPMFESIAAVRPPGESGEIVLSKVFFPVDATDLTKHMIDMYSSNVTEYTIEFNKEKAEEWQKVMLKHAPKIAERRLGFVKNRRTSEHSEYWNFVDFSYGSLLLVTHSPASEDTKEVLRKASQVFDLAYRRYKDLQKAESQAREAQIVASLERVRAATMAMHQSTELSNVLSTLFGQYDILGINPSHAVLTLINKEKNTLTFRSTGKNGYRVYAEQEVDLNLYDTWIDTAEKWKKSNPNAVNVNEYPQDILPEVWTVYKDILNAMPKKARPEIKDFPEGLFITEGYCQFGYIGFAHSRKPTEEEKDIVRRFAAEFGSLYQRFLDLQKAEAQAREAQIEAALERVRASTMAMHDSQELALTNAIVVAQTKSLINSLFAIGIHICHNDEPLSDSWIGDPEEGQMPYLVFDHSSDPLSMIMYNEWKNGNSFHVETMEGKALMDHFKFMGTQVPNREMFEPANLPTRLDFHFAYFSNGFLVFVTTKECPEQYSIFKRLANVFDQTYTRFLDLQKAEAQAREAQIEAALERVRSRSMAMHQSEEIGEVAKVLFQQLKSLGGELWASGFGFCEENSEEDNFWFVTETDVSPNVRIPNTTDLAHKKMYKGWKDKQDLFSVAKGGKELADHYKYMLTLPDIKPIFQGMLDNGIKFPTWQKWHAAYFKYGYLLAITTEDYENQAVFKRFAKAFEQAYTRFLDLQKAEAQAREAQIEVALEKIRSRTMAMQKGEELNDVVVLLYKELITLGITNFTTCGYVEINEQTRRQLTYVTGQGGDSLGLFYLPLEGDAVFDERYAAWKKQQMVFHQTVGGKKRRQHLEYAITTFNSKEAEEMVLTQFPDPTVFYCFNFSHGYLHLVGGSKLKKDEEVLLARFTKVFEQTYARFLDLKKAEIQTREAQINLAVERVRAKALAMHKSEEIIDVVAKLKNEVMNLDIPDVIAATIFLNEGDDKVRMWDLSSLEQDDNHSEIPFDVTFKIKKTDPNLYVKRVWENPEDYFVDIQDEKGFKRLIKWLRELDKTEIAKEVEEHIEKTRLKRLYHTVKKLQNGKLVIDLLSPPSDEMEPILTKMGAAFDLAYKRFEDLKRAEAQTKESQIQLALERVRARTMAMQHSDELREVVLEMYEQLQRLDFESQACNIIIIDEETNDQNYWVSGFSQELYPESYKVPNIDHPYMQQQIEAWKKGESYRVFKYEGTEKKKFDKIFFSETDFRKTPKEAQDMMQSLESVTLSTAFTKYGSLQMLGPVPLTEEKASILKRFVQVFDQTYTRFLDLKKAEAQAKEGQIEAALERVRSRTMAMHQTSELQEVIHTVHQELLNLDMGIFGGSFITINNDIDGELLFWGSGGTANTAQEVTLPYFDKPVYTNLLNSIKSGPGFFNEVFTATEKVEFFSFLFKHEPWSKLNSKEKKEVLSSSGGYTRSYCVSEHTTILVVNHFGRTFTTEENMILKRFAKVFEQTYTRFLDLQKAEAQAREAQIEMALEKVRSRTMAMQKSDELRDAAQVLFTEVQNLGIPSWSCGYNILGDDHKSAECYMSSEGTLQQPFTLYYKKEKSFLEQYHFFKSKKMFLVQEQKGKDLEEAYDYMKTIPKIGEIIVDLEASGISLPTHQFNHLCKFNKGYLLFITYEEVPEAHEIFKRFTAVFDQTYTRFLDLQKAEAQAKEAQIEATLERVRSQSMGMQSSKDLSTVTTEMFKQLRQFNSDLFATGIVFCDKHKGHVEQWHSIPNAGMMSPFIVPIDLDYIHQYRYDQWKNKTELFSVEIPSDFIEQHFEDIFNLPSAQVVLKQFEANKTPMPGAPDWEIDYGATFKQGYILVSALQPFEDAYILPRFAKVFEQAYTRFLDLQKAEEQARESKIEAALEKVRSRSLAMHKPDELQEVVAIVASKLKELGVIFDAGGVILCTYFPDNKDVVHWIAVPDFTSSGRYFVPYFDNPIFNDAWDSKAKGDAYFSQEFPLEAKNAFFKHAFKNSDYRQMPDDYKEFVLAADSHHLSAAWSKNSAIIIPSLSGVVPTDNDAQIMQRFARVFEQAYIRFMDLQQAEIREKEAIKQASLDRVRGEIASMRTTTDLERITPLIWKELTALGVPFFRCGVFIIREDEKMVHAYLSKPDGTSVAALHIPFNDNDNKLIKPTIENWRLQRAFKETWNQDQFIQQTNMFMEKGQIENPEAYEISETPPECLVLHLIPFKQGMVYVGNHEDLTTEQLTLVESLSTAFSVAYSRYEDFKALETAKNSLEHTINDLKSAQAQLIQAEKMASLGELTAGIAHEIQNPLNFVNNFSEVSEEMVDEMNEELENGDLEEAKAISQDLKINLSKINHHGKRADAIVKGMLEHSRINKGEKKQTDLNALIDEFVRLSYHGLRAKDKSFNADFKLNLDPNLPKVNLVSSDIGRVILNLVNNAFYACAERSRSDADKQVISGLKTYSPEVIVSSKQTEQGIQLSVKDNGGGIPAQVRDKIFQPFFTTKPTGKGTGLGLSLSYDIIKAHRGELILESSEGEGTLFSIQIPIQ